MDPRIHHSTQQDKAAGPFGFDLSRYVPAAADGTPAHAAALQALTHGGIYPTEYALHSIGLFDRAALDVLQQHEHLWLQQAATAPAGGRVLRLYVNILGRLHIRPVEEAPVLYSAEDRSQELGQVALDAAAWKQLVELHEAMLATEATAFAEVRQALDEVQARGELPQVLEEVIDHIEHVESVCFYVRDRFFALIERFVNLIDDKRAPGFLSALRNKPYAEWDTDEVLVVAALHALFQSGRSVRFEEFNGTLLSAHDLLARLHRISRAYEEAGCEVQVPPELGLFERARLIRQQTLRAVGKPWLRYRWIYGLNFQKTEHILPKVQPDEPESAWWDEFADDYRELVIDRGDTRPGEHVGMALLAHACLERDVAGVPCDRGSKAVGGWLEYLMEKTVASAVKATGADYGMSSSLRDVGRLVTYDEATLIDEIHALTPANFFTCFVSDRLEERLGREDADAIAAAVQKRMMFNRWHFIPGNLERPLIRSKRHWYYPPLIPDIAEHADMHRAAHNKARVKYSVRSPGPDMSRPSLAIGAERYRGFYDVRVVRMEGDGFTLEDVLRTRRRTLWLEAVYDAWTTHLMSPHGKRIEVTGFQVGSYLDLVHTPAPHGSTAHVPVHARTAPLHQAQGAA